MSHLWIFLRPVLALASEQVLGQAKRQSRARAGGKRQSRAHDHLCSVADKLEVQLELIAQRHLKDTVKDGRYSPLPILASDFHEGVFLSLLLKYLIFSVLILIYKIVLLVFYCTDSEPYENIYGESPKYVVKEE